MERTDHGDGGEQLAFAERGKDRREEIEGKVEMLGFGSRRQGDRGERRRKVGGGGEGAN